MVLKRISCAKPMSGLAEFNYSAFHTAQLCCAPVTASNRCVRQSLHISRLACFTFRRTRIEHGLALKLGLEEQDFGEGVGC